jgi:ribose-phosphate pyrophosphokinase
MLNRTHGTVKIFAGSSSRLLATKICEKLDLELGKMDVGRFSDGEVSVGVWESVRGCDVYIIQSTSSPVNENLMELLVIIDAMKRASAGRITAVMPYFGYARQDRKARARDPISAKLVADLLQTAGANCVLTMDLHSSQLQGFFNIPVDNLYGLPILSNYFKKNGYNNNDALTIISPDVGSVSRSRAMAKRFDAPLAIIDKRRPKANVMEVMNIIGDVKDRTCLMIDDMIDTAGTICQGAEALKNAGAAEVYACCSHAVLSGPAIERLEKACIKKVIVLDTIELDAPRKACSKIEVVTVSDLFAEAIERISTDLPVSKLYD